MLKRARLRGWRVVLYLAIFAGVMLIPIAVAAQRIGVQPPFNTVINRMQHRVDSLEEDVIEDDGSNTDTNTGMDGDSDTTETTD